MYNIISSREQQQNNGNQKKPKASINFNQYTCDDSEKVRNSQEDY